MVVNAAYRNMPAEFSRLPQIPDCIASTCARSSPMRGPPPNGDVGRMDDEDIGLPSQDSHPAQMLLGEPCLGGGVRESAQ